MVYDKRLLPQINSYRSVEPSPVQNEFIELGPWQISPPVFEPPPHTYRSTDELLPNEQDYPFPSSSPRASLSSSNQNAFCSGPWNGWKRGASFCLIVVTAVLLLNISVTAWAAAAFGLSGGIGTIRRDDCAAIKSAGLWLHIGINIVSTMLLGASNYYMQCLCSPTRQEVDKAHSQRLWLDIGIQSMRNLGKIGRTRMVLWICLAATSIPLHIMFNSAIFVSLTANEYTVVTVTEDFVNGADWTLTGYDDYHQSIIAEMQQNISQYERLDQASCIKDYGVDYLSSRRHAIVVVTNSSTSDTLLGILDWTYGQPQNSWVCGTTLGDNMTLLTLPISDFDCSISVALANDTWYMGDQLVEYCLSEPVPDICRLQFAVPIMVVVLSCNFVKLLCMAFTVWRCKEFNMVTLGDAVGSFLERPDRHTPGMCTATKKEIEIGDWTRNQPKRWESRRSFRCEAVGVRRFILSNSFCALACIALSILLRYAIQNTTTASDIATLYSLGFGTVSASSLIRWNHPIFGSPGVMKNVLLANSPQLILSLLYIMYNRMYTCMSFSKEWDDFAHRRRSLRVTSPRGSQRSTYFLSLPYHYVIPILAISVTTHWILSQSLFLVAIDVFDEEGNLDTPSSILTCGFSCIALIFLIGIGWLIFISGVLSGLRRYKGGIPLVGSCSAAISAACHPLADESDVALVPVKWGVVGIDKGVGHCTLSGRYVSPPVTFRLYMGKTDLNRAIG